MPALMLVMALGAFEGMVVGTAMPRVVASLGGLALYNWVFTGYMLVATVTIPLFGHLGDRLGRKRVYMAGVTVFTLGALLSALAPTMGLLIAARSVQGLGFGAMFPMGMAIVGELFPPSERGRVQAYFAPIFAIGGILGPSFGGYVVDTLGWRWVFGLVVPLGLVALTGLWRLIPARPAPGTTGMGILRTAVIALVRPFQLLKDPVFANSAATEFLSGTMFFGTMAMVPLYLQGELGMSAGASGIVLAPVTLAVLLANVASGQLIMRMQRYKAIAVTGLSLQALGYGLLRWLGPTAAPLALAPAFLLGTVGMGMMIPVYTTVVQNSVHDDRLGEATAGLQFFSQLGEALGITILAMAFVHGMQQAGVHGDPNRVFEPGALAKLGVGAQALRGAIARGFESVTWIWAGAAALSLGLGLVLRDAHLRGRD